MSSESSSGPGEEKFPPQGQDMQELKEQFEEQQSLIAHLKEVLQNNEQQLAHKEKEVEEYGVMLSNIKSRSKAAKRSSKISEAKKQTCEEDETGAQHADTVNLDKEETSVKEEHASNVVEKKEERRGKCIDKSKHGNLILLRKKLEENRMKFEQRGKEMSENKRGIEEMVESLRLQLQERDQTIQLLQRSLEIRPPPAPSKETTVEKEEQGNLNDQSDPKEMYAQIVYKDNKIIQLNNRIMELEVKVLDLQENLKEKDAVIDARTKAITLMSEDMSRKSKSTLDTLDDTREQMRLMQNNFVTLEARMKEEKEQLTKKLEDRERKLLQVDESNKKLESVRFDLTTRIAELQEKVVNLQTHNFELQKWAEGGSKRRDHKGGKEDSRVEELLHALDDSNKQIIKIKAQHKNKMKSLNKQLDSLKKVSETSEELLRLQQQIAELEEDKGNLQLHLVDFDEIKAAEEHWKLRCQELEERVKQQNQDLDNHLHALSSLETEKINFLEDLQRERLHTSALENEVTRLKSNLLEAENQKVATEMKAVELEEQVDLLSHEKVDLQEENRTLLKDRTELKLLRDTLQQEKIEMQAEIISLQAQLQEIGPGDTDSNRSEFQMVSSSNSDEEKWKRLSPSEEALSEEKHMKDSSNVELSLKLLEAELDHARRTISQQKEITDDLNLKLEAREEEIEMHQEIISKLEQLGRETGVHEGEVDDGNKISEIVKELNEMAGDLEEWKKRCSEVEDRLKTLENEKENLESKLEDVTNENELLNKQIKLQNQVSEDLLLKSKEQSKVLSEKDEKIIELQLIIDENRIIEQEEITGSENAAMLEKMCSKLELDIEDKSTKLLLVQENIKAKEEILEKLEISLNTMASEISEKDKIIENLQKECDYLKSVEQMKPDEGSVVEASNSKKIAQLNQDMDAIRLILSEKEKDLEHANHKITELTEKAKKLAMNLKAKAVSIRNLEEKVNKCEDVVKSREKDIADLTKENTTLVYEQQSLKANIEKQSNEIYTMSEQYTELGTCLKSQEIIIEQLSQDNSELRETNKSLENDAAMINQHSDSLRDQNCSLENKIHELENKINGLEFDLKHNQEEITIFKERESSLMQQHYSLLSTNQRVEEDKIQAERKNQELVSEIMKKEEEIAEISLRVNELTKRLESKDFKAEEDLRKFKELEKIIVSKEMESTASQEKVAHFQRSWCALEAKLQEREAFIESLEHEIAQSRAREWHLEEGLSNIEDRRRSLETRFVALGEQLQQSDRSKEEAEEHEGILEHRLAALAASEEALKNKLECLTESNAELSQRILEITTEKETIKKSLTNAESNIKNAQKEIERLVYFEQEYNQSLETIENLRAELKRSVAEFDWSMKEKSEEASRYSENLELDMKNLNTQIDMLETEKRALMEHCEKLNDIKLVLEEEVEILQEKNEQSLSRTCQLEKTISQKDADFNERLETKERKISALQDKVQELIGKTQEIGAGVCMVKVEEECQDATDILQLKSEITDLRSLLSQKESEVQSYQNRLLQMQFTSSSGSTESHDSEIQISLKNAEDLNIRFQKELNMKEVQLGELTNIVENTKNEMDILQDKLSLSQNKVQEMLGELLCLKEEIKNKDVLLQQQIRNAPSMTTTSLTQQLENIHTDYQSQMSLLKHQNDNLYQELLQEKAKYTVHDVISTAKEHVHDIKNDDKLTNIEEAKGDSEDIEPSREVVQGKSTLSLQELEYVQMENVPFGSTYPQETYFSDDINALKSELNVVKSERDIVVSKINEMELKNAKSNLTQELAEKLGDLTRELDHVKHERDEGLLMIEKLEGELEYLQAIGKQSTDPQVRFDAVVTTTDSVSTRLDLHSKDSSVESECIIEKVDSTWSSSPDVGVGQTNTINFESYLEKSMQSEVLQEENNSTVVDLASSWEGEMADEEGWGWGTDEALLEEEHLQKQRESHLPTESVEQLQQQISDLKTKIITLQKEKSNIENELKASQVRSGKMLKKLKDLKLKHERLMHENQELTTLKKTGEFGGLDLAIEEELKIRIDSLEKELKECKGERETAKLEKEGLQKRIDILSAANERYAERECQGINVELWQNKNKDLMNQVEALEWRIGELMEEKATQEDSSDRNLSDWKVGELSDDTNKKTIQELEEQVTALAMDNEQLQSMLEEQRNLRVAAESALKDLEQFASSKEANVLLQKEYMLLRENYDLICKELEQLRSARQDDSLLVENAAPRENYEMFIHKELEKLHTGSNSDILPAEYASLRKSYESMNSEMEKLQSQLEFNNTSQANYESLQIVHEKLVNEMGSLQKDYCDLTLKYTKLEKEFNSHMEECSQKYATSQENYEKMLKEIGNEQGIILQRYEQLSNEHTALCGELQHLGAEKDEYRNSYENLKTEVQRLNAVNEELTIRCKAVPLEGTIRTQHEEKEALLHVESLEKCSPYCGLHSASTQTSDIIILPDVEAQLLESFSHNAELRQQIQQRVDEVNVLREMLLNEQQEWAKVEQVYHQKINVLESELKSLGEASQRESETREYLTVKEHEISNLRCQLSSTEDELSQAQRRMEDLETMLQLKDEDAAASRPIEDQESMIQQFILSKEEEIKGLQVKLKEKECDKDQILYIKDQDIENLKLQIKEQEIQIRDLSALKDEDICNLRIQLSELEQRMVEAIHTKDEDIHSLQTKLTENDSHLKKHYEYYEDQEDQITELRELLEAREDEIREAVLQIRDKNIEIQKLKQAIKTKSEEAVEGELSESMERKSESDSSQQNELDLALYMLHQRDVRCEELTLELMQLLEERDTLQLRLSTALKINEELRSKVNKSSTASSPVRSLKAIVDVEDASSSSLNLEQVESAGTPVETGPVADDPLEPKEDLEALANKLSQLHSVDYRRDVTLRDEREQRHSEQIMLLQQRGSGVLVESNYTLSRDVQSPSTVLLNWIWGRSTPKVMHI